MKELSKTEARKKIDSFFLQDSFSSEEMKKIKKLAMKHTIRLGSYRTKFCKSCYSDLRNGKVRVTNSHRMIICSKCKAINKIKIS